MIYSMTAFARTQYQSEWGSIVCELRSINHRFLEVGVHVPDFLRVLEMPIREKIRKIIKRGKIECLIRCQTTNNSALVNINEKLAQELCRASERVGSFLTNPGPILPADILRFQGVLESSEIDLNQLQPEIMQTLEKSLDDLITMRGREGEDLKETFLTRMDALEVELTKVKQRLPDILIEQNERLKKRFNDVKLELDNNRLEQEMVLFIQKMDVTEEIERTQTHINEIRRILKEGGTVGRRLDFLLQELNREANTLGSKSVDSVVTHAAVEMKVLIEQVREQVQNIE